MGANQAVLVRNMEARARMPKALASAIVLTVEEAKGLEFDDVCLYDFFSDSSADADAWAVLNTLSGAGHGKEKAFDASAHSLLCEELKALYVGITRARKRCFVFDRDEARRQPAFDYFGKFAKVAEDGTEQELNATATAAGKTTEADWVRRGKNFVDNKLWAHAERAYLKGGASGVPEAFHAGGMRLASSAMGSKQAKVEKFKRAAIAFLKSATLRAPGKVGDRELFRAAKSFCVAATAADSGDAKAKLLGEAGLVLDEGLRKPWEAACCFAHAGAAATRGAAKVYWAKALRAYDGADLGPRDVGVAANLAKLAGGQTGGALVESVTAPLTMTQHGWDKLYAEYKESGE